MAKKRNLKRETESFLIAAQMNTIRTNHIKVRIDKTRRNSKSSHVVIQMKPCSKLAEKEYKTSHDWVEQGDPLGVVQEI